MGVRGVAWEMVEAGPLVFEASQMLSPSVLNRRLSFFGGLVFLLKRRRTQKGEGLFW